MQQPRVGGPGGLPVLLMGLLGILVWTASAAASPLFELVGDPSERGGLAGRFGGASASSAYFNPALLPSAPEGMTVGVFVISDAISINVDNRPAGSDVPITASGAYYRMEGSDARVNVSPPPIPTAWLENGVTGTSPMPGVARPRQAAGSSGNTRVFTPIGIVKPLIGDKFVIGFTALLATGDFTTTSGFYVDEREQYFTNSLHPELYADRLTAMSMAVGFGSQATDWLAVGLSFTFNLSNEATAPNFVPDPGEFDALLIDNSVAVKSSVAPHLGVAVSATEWLQLTATFHSPQSLKVIAQFSSLLPDGTEQFAKKTFTHDYVPWSASVGGNVRVLDGAATRLRLLAGAKLVNWPSYRDRHNYNPTGDYAWKMTVAPTVGARFEHRDTELLLDATFEQSPVPEQDGRSNYVDNDRVGVLGGAHYRFELFGMRWRAGATAQLHRLLPRDQTKDLSGEIVLCSDVQASSVCDEVPDNAEFLGDGAFEPVEPREGLQTNNPGFPGFSSEGWLYGGGVTLALLFGE